MKRILFALLIGIGVSFAIRAGAHALMLSLAPPLDEIEAVTGSSYHHITRAKRCYTGAYKEAWVISLAKDETASLISDADFIRELDGSLTYLGSGKNTTFSLTCKSPLWWKLLAGSEWLANLLLFLMLGGLIVGAPLVGIKSMFRSGSNKRLIRHLETTSSIDELLQAADNRDERVQNTVAVALERLNTPESIEALLSIVEKHKSARIHAAASLARMYRSGNISDLHRKQILSWRSKIEFLLGGESLDS